MAKAKVVTDAEVAPQEAAPAPPTLREAAQASTDAANERLEGLVARAAGTDSAPAAPAQKTPEEEYNEWYSALPEDKRNLLVSNVVTNYTRQLDETYGPEVGQVLAAVRQDPELKKKLSRLSDDKFRSWVFETAASIYDDPRFAEPTHADGAVAADPQLSALANEVQSLKADREREKTEREYEMYRKTRQDEYSALLNLHPNLKFDAGDKRGEQRVNAIIEEAERRSQSQKRVIPYADVAKEFLEMWDFQASSDGKPPRAIPAASPTTIPGPQAPRTKFESRAGIRGTLDQHGGIGQLAAALRR